MILAIESSCDESALAVFDPKKGIIGEWVSTQLDLHKQYGGVVPALASREHLRAFGPLLQKAQDCVNLSQLDTIAVTYGPGLAGCLALGIGVGKSLSLALNKPLFGVNHLRGHVFSPFIELHKSNPQTFESTYAALLPHLGLLVSGGNTLLFEIDLSKNIKILGQTVDDAAGEALDKGAKLLGMPYPGGALIEKKALEGDPNKYDFPRSFMSRGDYRFSYSGLKTSLRYQLEKMSDSEVDLELPHLCASYQQAVMESLVGKVKWAFESRVGHYKSIGLSGGVSNNKKLRSMLTQLAETQKTPIFIAEPRHTGDNAAMIAFTAFIDRVNCIESQNFNLEFDPSLLLA